MYFSEIFETGSRINSDISLLIYDVFRRSNCGAQQNVLPRLDWGRVQLYITVIVQAYVLRCVCPFKPLYEDVTD